MSGNVEVVAGFQPDRIFFRDVAKGATVDQTVELVGEKAGQIKLDSLSIDKPDEVRAEPVQVDGKPALKVTFKAPGTIGRFTANITAKTGLDKPEQLTLMVIAEVTGDLVLDRNYALFAPFDEKNPPRFTVSVRSLSNKPFRITKVVDPLGAVEAKTTQAKDNWQVDLILKSQPKSTRGKLELHTDRADQPVLALSYNVRGQAGSLPRNIQVGRDGKRTLLPAGAKLPERTQAPLRLAPSPSTRPLPLKVHKAPPATTPVAPKP